jgi:hypothetical protein
LHLPATTTFESETHLIALRRIDAWTTQLFTMTPVTPLRALDIKIEDGLFSSARALALRMGWDLDLVTVRQWKATARTKPDLNVLKAVRNDGAAVDLVLTFSCNSDNNSDNTSDNTSDNNNSSSSSSGDLRGDHGVLDVALWTAVIREGLSRTKQLSLHAGTDSERAAVAAHTRELRLRRRRLVCWRRLAGMGHEVTCLLQRHSLVTFVMDRKAKWCPRMTDQLPPVASLAVALAEAGAVEGLALLLGCDAGVRPQLSGRHLLLLELLPVAVAPDSFLPWLHLDEIPSQPLSQEQEEMEEVDRWEEDGKEKEEGELEEEKGDGDYEDDAYDEDKEGVEGSGMEENMQFKLREQQPQRPSGGGGKDQRPSLCVSVAALQRWLVRRACAADSLGLTGAATRLLQSELALKCADTKAPSHRQRLLLETQRQLTVFSSLLCAGYLSEDAQWPAWLLQPWQERIGTLLATCNRAPSDDNECEDPTIDPNELPALVAHFIKPAFEGPTRLGAPEGLPAALFLPAVLSIYGHPWTTRAAHLQVEYHFSLCFLPLFLLPQSFQRGQALKSQLYLLCFPTATAPRWSNPKILLPRAFFTLFLSPCTLPHHRRTTLSTRCMPLPSTGRRR